MKGRFLRRADPGLRGMQSPRTGRKAAQKEEKGNSSSTKLLVHHPPAPSSIFCPRFVFQRGNLEQMSFSRSLVKQSWEGEQAPTLSQGFWAVRAAKFIPGMGEQSPNPILSQLCPGRAQR